MKLEFINIEKSYSNKKALDGLNLSLSEGIYGILGPNGAGKSTMMNLLSDNVKRETGKILFDGVDILELGPKFRKYLGYMPQQQGVYEAFSARTFLLYVANLKGIPKKEAKKQVEYLLNRVNLHTVAKKKISEFSGGMKQRVLLAQALLGNPKVLILDEPTAGLDPKERIRIRNLISELAKDKIILVATHIVSDIECIADQILILKNGSVIQKDTPSGLISSISGKVFEKKCGKSTIDEEITSYSNGNLIQREDGLYLRVVGEKESFSEEFTEVKEGIGLEDVYLYYIG